MENEPTSDVGYPIRVVARRTGLKQDVIRAWERRYGAVSPTRSQGRHRLYSDDEIRRLQLLRRATEAGHSIGRIATLDEAALIELLEADALDREDPGHRPSSGGNPYVAACLEAVADLDGDALEGEIQRAAVEVGRDRVVDEVLAPLIEAISRGYDDGTLRLMHEHLVSSVVPGVVQSFRAAMAASESAPRLVVSTPARQHHELGAVLATSVASSVGWRATYVGANLPAEEIAAAARVRQSTAVALSIAFPPDDDHLPGELRRLRRSLPGLPIIVGGQAVAAYREVLDEIGAIVVPGFADFRKTLASLRWQRRTQQRPE
jgi:DNA-binding transcriptional MerR regulator/methylmalonyl-CoA mutase cobalamin-binding subunit